MRKAHGDRAVPAEVEIEPLPAADTPCVVAVRYQDVAAGWRLVRPLELPAHLLGPVGSVDVVSQHDHEVEGERVVERGHPGLVTDSWLGLAYPDGVTRWDLALLEILWALVMASLFASKPVQCAAWLPGSLALFRLAIMPLQAGSPDFWGPAILAGWCGYVAIQRPGSISTSTKS